MNPNNPVGDLIALAERLSSLLAEESALLAQSRPQDIAALQSDKSKLARAFEAQVALVDKEPALLAELEPGLKATLRKVMAKARDAITENARLLRAARDANQRVINLIVKAVEGHSRRLDVYTASGNIGSTLYGARQARKTVSLSVNQQL